MKVTMEAYSQRATIELDHDDITQDEMKQVLKQLCAAMGWHPLTIDEIFGEENEEVVVNTEVKTTTSFEFIPNYTEDFT